MKTYLRAMVSAAVFFTVLALPLGAQKKLYGRNAQHTADDVFARPPDQRSLHDLREAIDVSKEGNLGSLEFYILSHPDITESQAATAAQALLTYVEQTRQDKQVGTDASASGTTSIVSKGVASIIGVALESGSASRSSSNNVTTVTINAAQALNFLSAGAISPCPLIGTNCKLGSRVLSGLSVSNSFDVSKASTSTDSSAADAALESVVGSAGPAFSGVSVREDFHVRKKVVSPKDLLNAYQAKAYQDALTTYGTAFGNAAQDLEKNPAYTKALTDTIAALQDPNAAASDDQVNAILLNFEKTLATLISGDASLTTDLSTYATAANAYYGARDAALDTVLFKWSYAFQYDDSRVASQPDQSTFKSIYSYRSDSGTDRILQITANGGATIYNSLLGSSTSRFRSAQAAFQLDYTASRSTSVVQAAVSGGYYFQYMVADGLLTLPSTQLAPGTTIPLPGNASQLLNTSGPIHIGQGKVTLSIKGTNVSIPLALTASNRTDLIKASRVGGNFGITFDFSSLFTSIKK